MIKRPWKFFFWRRVDKTLRRFGLMRCSQERLKELRISGLNGERRTILIELNDGFRFSGYLDSGLSIIKNPENPLLRGLLDETGPYDPLKGIRDTFSPVQPQRVSEHLPGYRPGG